MGLFSADAGDFYSFGAWLIDLDAVTFTIITANANPPKVRESAFHRWIRFAMLDRETRIFFRSVLHQRWRELLLWPRAAVIVSRTRRIRCGKSSGFQMEVILVVRRIR
jgi:hypothetical protein